jgi:hypothetical protein
MAPSGVRKCSICRTEVVIKTKRNSITVECDTGYNSPKITIQNLEDQICEPMSQHFNKFMRLNVDNFSCSVYYLPVYISCITQHVNNILMVCFQKKKNTKICSRVTRDPVSGFRAGVALIWQKRSWNIVRGVW